MTITTTDPTTPSPANPARQQVRVLTGDRPTGALHLGHYFGSLQNRVRLQNEGADLIVLIADYQVLTDRDLTADLSGHVRGLMLDYLAVGLDPDRATFFTHSGVPALNQLVLPFLSLVSTAELERNPTVKEEIAASRRGAVSGLMLTYPVHQAADILFCGANLVPVGEDQLPHLELTRSIARRFNRRYGAVFVLPEATLSLTPRLLGTDGAAKMSKSRGNAIALSATPDETARLIRGATTDSDRIITYDPILRPQVANLILVTALCSGRLPEQVADEVGAGGAGALKRLATEAVNEYFAPIRARRALYADDPGQLSRIIATGNERANDLADATLARVHAAMGTRYA